MTTREFYEKKAKECGYDDFLHWIDCFDSTLQPEKIVEWTDELVGNLTPTPKETLKVYRCEFGDAWSVGTVLVLTAYNQTQAEDIVKNVAKNGSTFVVNEVSLHEPQIIEYIY